jgi:hypothetical protein
VLARSMDALRLFIYSFIQLTFLVVYLKTLSVASVYTIISENELQRMWNLPGGNEERQKKFKQDKRSLVRDVNPGKMITSSVQRLHV